MLSSFPSGYDVPVLSQYLDWIAVMTYDYHGQWDKKTGHVSPMYGHPGDDNPAFNTVYISVFINWFMICKEYSQNLESYIFFCLLLFNVYH